MFINRIDAAKQLVTRLPKFANTTDIAVLAIPMGGLVIGAVIAHAIQAPLDIILAKKIGAPYNPELAIGAATLTFFFVQPPYKKNNFEHQAHEIQELLAKRNTLYHELTPIVPLANKIVLITDDGIATGQTMYAAIQEVKKQHPKRIIVAVPVISAQTKEELDPLVDQIISVLAPRDLSAIGAYYQNFEQVSDQEAIEILTHTNEQKRRSL